MMVNSVDVGMDKICVLCEGLSLKKNTEKRAVSLFESVAGDGFLRGRTINSVAGACVYVACREKQPEIMLWDIAKRVGENARTIGRIFRALTQVADINTAQCDSAGLLRRAVDHFKLSDAVLKNAMSILKKYDDMDGTSGKHPGALAGAALYIAGQRNNAEISQKMISRRFGISDMSIRTHSSSMKKCGL